MAARDPLVPYYTSVPEGYTEEHAREFIARGGDNFAIVDAETDEILGVVGFLLMDHRRGHFGYWVGKDARGGAWRHGRSGCSRSGPRRSTTSRASS